MFIVRDIVVGNDEIIFRDIDGEDESRIPRNSKLVSCSDDDSSITVKFNGAEYSYIFENAFDYGLFLKLMYVR